VKRESLRISRLLLAIAMFAGLAIMGFAERAAAQDKSAAPPGPGQIKGTAKDEEGKPMAGVTVQLSPPSGADIIVTTDAEGKFAKPGLPPGRYTISFMQNDKTLYKVAANVATGHDTVADLLMSDARVKEFQRIKKKELEDEAQFGKLKTHFNAGNAALDEEKAARDEMMKLPPANRAEAQEKLETAESKALGEYQQALAAVTDPADAKNRASVFAQMAAAYEMAGKYEEAVQAYQQDVAARPDPGAYNNLGNDLGRLGRMDEAKAAFEQSATLDPQGAALAYRNFGVILYNAAKFKDSPGPELLKKATELEPNNQQGWFLLAEALAANMAVEQTGEKLTFKFPEGTASAFQKCIDIDPKTPLADMARKSIEELNQYGLGVDVKSKVKH
jgi:tetratricopeptide (TPR) repeat protein